MLEHLITIKQKYWREISQITWFLFIIMWILFPFVGGLSIELTISFSLFVLLLHVSEISSRVSKPQIIVSSHRSEQVRLLGKHLDANSAKTVRAIFSSGSWFRIYVELIAQSAKEIQLLIQHPEVTQHPDVLYGIKALLAHRSVIPRSNVKIFFYKETPCYEGLLINNDFISSSWYTYFRRESGTYVRGAGNLKLTIFGPSVEYNQAYEMFDKTWNDLIINAIDIDDYCKSSTEDSNIQSMICSGQILDDELISH